MMVSCLCPCGHTPRDGDVRYRLSLCCSRTNHTATAPWLYLLVVVDGLPPPFKGSGRGRRGGGGRWIPGAHWAFFFAVGDGPLPPTRLTRWGRGRDGDVTSRVHCSSPTGARLQIPPPQHCPGPPLSTLQAVAVGFFFCLPTVSLQRWSNQLPAPNWLVAEARKPRPAVRLPILPPPTPAEPGSFAGLVLVQRDQGLSFNHKGGREGWKKKRRAHGRVTPLPLLPQCPVPSAQCPLIG